jgi:hypothetical protein
VVAEAAALLQTYRVTEVTGDRYSAEFVVEAFRAHGIRYSAAELDRSALYLELLPRVNAGQVDLLDCPDLLRELRGLERRRGGTGRDRVDHGPGGHDDLANAAAGALVSLAQALPALCFGNSDKNFGRPLPGPSLEQIHADTDREMAERATASASMIQDAIRQHGVWFPGD